MVSQIKRGLVIGCGGTLGGAWSVAALHELARATGWDPRSAHRLIGTSAGSELVTLLGSGAPVSEILDAQLGQGELARAYPSVPRAFPPLPAARLAAPSLAYKTRSVLTALSGLAPVGRGDASFVSALVDSRVKGAWVEHPATWVVAVDLATGDRVAFGSPGAPRASMRDAVRASWAIPGWFPPVEIEGRRYVDGGVRSPASADLATGLDEVIVIAPMASSDPWKPRGLARVEAVVRRSMKKILDAEAASLRAAGARVVRVEPGPDDLAVMGANFMDGSRRLRVLESSLRTCRRTVERALEGARS